MVPVGLSPAPMCPVDASALPWGHPLPIGRWSVHLKVFRASDEARGGPGDAPRVAGRRITRGPAPTTRTATRGHDSRTAAGATTMTTDPSAGAVAGRLLARAVGRRSAAASGSWSTSWSPATRSCGCSTWRRRSTCPSNSARAGRTDSGGPRLEQVHTRGPCPAPAQVAPAGAGSGRRPLARTPGGAGGGTPRAHRPAAVGERRLLRPVRAVDRAGRRSTTSPTTGSWLPCPRAGRHGCVPTTGSCSSAAVPSWSARPTSPAPAAAAGTST